MPFWTTITMAPSDQTHSSKKALRILYADDLLGLRELARLILSHDGHAVECVADGHLAMDRLRADPAAFDLVITDHHMPDWNGLELVTWLRRLPFPGKILVFTSDENPDLGKAYRKLRVDRILHKPTTPALLRQVVAEFA
jgi:CheY-like chemotaxis protein